MENKPKTHMLNPLEVRSEQILFKNGNICSSSCPGIYWSCFFRMWEICSLFQRKSNYFPTELTWRLLWNVSENQGTVYLFLSPSIKKYLKFYFSESLTMILIHILQLEKGARTKFWEVSSTKIWKLVLRTSCSRMRHWLGWNRWHTKGIHRERY